ncbi:hypothetical protein F66182_1096 [Fusarium sp. NRRL 66182]|nr:hypothetical protein F66182_1096 [Fusarium sp. NRRL 66182]
MYKQATFGDVDFITGDYLAEVNMGSNAEAFAQGQHPGYESTALEGIRMTLNVISTKRIKVIVNGGALNPRGLAEDVASLVKEKTLPLSVAYVTGDDILTRVRQHGQHTTLPHLDSCYESVTVQTEALGIRNSSPDQVVSANAYLGARGIVAALRNGADIVITGRVSDASPVIAAAWYWWSWEDNDYDRLAGALVAGHLIECSAYVTGGNFAGFNDPKYGDWQRFIHPGFPIAEIYADGSCVITKHQNTGGVVDEDTVRCQLLYEIQGNVYLHSDSKAVLDGVEIKQEAEDRVRVTGIRGLPPPPTTKAAIFYKGGFESQLLVNTAGYGWEEKCAFFETQMRLEIGDKALSKIDFLEFQRIGVPAEDPSCQNSSTIYIRVVGQAKEATALLAVPTAVKNISLRHFHGFHSSLDMRTALPKPFVAYYPALWDQALLEEKAHFVTGGSGERSSLVVDAGHPSVYEALTERSSYDAEPTVSFEGPTRRIRLGDIALARSGDKGSNLNVGVFVRTPKQWEWLRSYLSREQMWRFLGEDANDTYTVERVEFPKILAVHFVVYGILGRGVSSSTRLDTLGKGFADYLRHKLVEDQLSPGKQSVCPTTQAAVSSPLDLPYHATSLVPMPPAAKRKAGSAPDSSERKRAQNRISQQCLREKNLTYIRNLEETIDLLQKVATGTDSQNEPDRYSVLLEAHLKLIAENRKLEEALLRLRKKLLSFGQAATAAAGEYLFRLFYHLEILNIYMRPITTNVGIDDEVFDSVLRRRDADNPRGTQAQNPEPSTEVVTDEVASILDSLTDAQSFPNMQEHAASHADMLKDPSFSLSLSTLGNGRPGHETPQTFASSTTRPEYSFLTTTATSEISQMSQISPRSLLFVPDQFSITSMSVFGSKLLGACRRHLDKAQACGNQTDMVEKIVKTAVRFSMRCAGLESYAYGVSRNPTHFWGIDLFNWPEIRDQLVLETDYTDFDEILRDLVLHSVIEPVNHTVAVNVLDVFENQVLRRAKTGHHQQPRQKSYFTDPSWTLFQIGPEHGRWYSADHDIVEEAIFQELDQQINAADGLSMSAVEENRANDVAEFLGLDDLYWIARQLGQSWADGATLHTDRTPVTTTSRPKPVRGVHISILSVGGLTCTSCVSDLQNSIETIPGVAKATVSLALLRAQVEYRDFVTEAAIVDAIRSAGYDADPIPASDSQGWASIMPMIQAPSSSRKQHVEACRRAFIVSTVASFIFYTSRSVSMLWPIQRNYLELILYLAVALSLLAGSHIHLEALRSVWYGRRPNMATLGSLGITLALMRAIVRGPEKAFLSALEAIPVLSTSVLGSRLLKATLSQRNQAFASPLSSLIPATATVCNRVDGYDSTSIPIDMLSLHDKVVVAQGEYIPGDGVVENIGSALVMETWLNGSLEPRVVERGDTVFAGCRVHEGRLVCRTTACGRSTRLGELLTSVVTAELAHTEPRVYRATSWFAGAIIFLAAALLVAHFASTTNDVWTDGLGQASALLLAACPYLHIKSRKVKLTQASTLVQASKLGVRLVTSYARIQNAASSKTILFDKTGTLTHGDLQVSHVCFSKDWSSPQQQAMLWKAMQEVETGIKHPAARGIVQESLSRGLSDGSADLPAVLVSEVSHELGRGAQGAATFTGSESATRRLAIGSRKFIESLNIAVDLSQVPEKLRCGTTTPVVVAVDGRQAGVIILQDMVRSDAISVIHQLKGLGVTVGMVTGDNAAAAASVARQVGIDSNMVFADALPKEKSRIVAKFLQRGPAMFVGDNYNDILCFASSSFSVCMPGSDMRSVDGEPADATLISSDTALLSRIPLLIRLSRRTVAIVTQNHCWAVIYNILSIAWVLGIAGMRPPSP